LPKIFDIVFSFAGDSTMTKYFDITFAPLSLSIYSHGYFEIAFISQFISSFKSTSAISEITVFNFAEIKNLAETPCCYFSSD
jgi:hypothetical protein